MNREAAKDMLLREKAFGIYDVICELEKENEELKTQIEKLKVESKEKIKKDVIAEIVQRIECRES